MSNVTKLGSFLLIEVNVILLSFTVAIVYSGYQFSWCLLDVSVYFCCSSLEAVACCEVFPFVTAILSFIASP